MARHITVNVSKIKLKITFLKFKSAMLPPEIWTQVAEFIENGRDWKSFIFTCRMFYDMHGEPMLLKHANPLWSLILRHPDKPWNWSSVSMSPWTTFEIVSKYPRFPWQWQALMTHLVFPENFLSEAIEFMKTFPIHDENDYQTNLIAIKAVEYIEYISLNSKIPPKFIREYHDAKFPAPSHVYGIAWHNIISCSISEANDYTILTNPELVGDYEICTNHICLNDSISCETFDTIDPDNLNFQYLSSLKGLKLWFFEKHLYKNWDFHYLSHNKSVTVEFLEAAPDENWDWYVLSESPDIARMFRRFPKKLWNFELLSCNPELPWDIVRDNLELPWDHNLISHYMKLDMSIIREYSDFCWDFMELLQNINIDFDELIKEFHILNNGLIVHKCVDPMTLDELIKIELNDPAIKEFEYTELYGPQWLISFRQMPMKLIEKYSQIRWNYDCITVNPLLEWTFVDKHIDDNWDWNMLSMNGFGRECHHRLQFEDDSDDDDME
jgi:hypothetical protein